MNALYHCCRRMRLKRNYHFVQYSQGTAKATDDAPKDPIANMDDRLLAGTCFGNCLLVL